MNRFVTLALCVAVAAIGIAIVFNGGFGGIDARDPMVIPGIIIAACGLGGAMGISMVVAGIGLVLALAILVMAGFSVGSLLLCCIPAMMLVLHLARTTGNAN